MKRKESTDKTKHNQDLANQLKARLFDKGKSFFIKVSAMVLYRQSSDRLKIITKYKLTKIQLSLLQWEKQNRTIV
jgi:hypothetical protein